MGHTILNKFRNPSLIYYFSLSQLAQLGINNVRRPKRKVCNIYKIEEIESTFNYFSIYMYI